MFESKSIPIVNAGDKEIRLRPAIWMHEKEEVGRKQMESNEQQLQRKLGNYHREGERQLPPIPDRQPGTAKINPRKAP